MRLKGGHSKAVKLLKGGTGGDPENISGNVKVINMSIDDIVIRIRKGDGIWVGRQRTSDGQILDVGNRY